MKSTERFITKAIIIIACICIISTVLGTFIEVLYPEYNLEGLLILCPLMVIMTLVSFISIGFTVKLVFFDKDF